MKFGIAMQTVASLEATIEEQAEEIADLREKLASAERERDEARAALARCRDVLRKVLATRYGWKSESCATPGTVGDLLGVELRAEAEKEAG